MILDHATATATTATASSPFHSLRRFPRLYSLSPPSPSLSLSPNVGRLCHIATFAGGQPCI